mgnify:CR=1 FL=1
MWYVSKSYSVFPAAIGPVKRRRVPGFFDCPMVGVVIVTTGCSFGVDGVLTIGVLTILRLIGFAPHRAPFVGGGPPGEVGVWI